MPVEYRSPKYDLDQSIDVARRITDRGSGAAVSGAELAAFLGYTGTNNGAYLNRVSAARMFGLIEGNANSISATDRAEQIIHPDYPQTADRARLDAFRSVPLFGAFLEAFKGRELPDEAGMVNALVGRFRVPEKEAKPVLARLLLSADQAGLFRVAGAGRMIEPTLAPPPSAPAKTDDLSPLPALMLQDSPDRRFPKIIEATLDLMPSGPPWDEAEYEEWLAFFDQACRVYYRIARGSKIEKA